MEGDFTDAQMTPEPSLEPILDSARGTFSGRLISQPPGTPAVGRPVGALMVATILLIGGLISLVGPSALVGKAIGLAVTLLLAIGLYWLARRPLRPVSKETAAFRMSLFFFVTFGLVFVQQALDYYESNPNRPPISADFLVNPVGQGLTALLVVQLGVVIALSLTDRAKELRSSLLVVAPLPALFYMLMHQDLPPYIRPVDSAPHTLFILGFVIASALSGLLTRVAKK